MYVNLGLLSTPSKCYWNGKKESVVTKEVI